jgi:hypothetical protein
LNANTLSELVNSLFPNNQKSTETFFETDNLLPLLSNVLEQKEILLAKSEDDNKIYLAFFLTTRIKELYCRCGRFKEGREVDIARVNKFFKYLLEKGQVDSDFFPLILNHLTCSVESGELDNQLYEVMKLLNPSQISPFPWDCVMEYIDENSERTLFAGYDYERLVKVLIPFIKMLCDDPNDKQIDKWLFAVSHLFIEHGSLFYGEDEQEIARCKELYECFSKLKDSIVQEDVLQITVLNLNLCLYCLHLKDTEISAFEQMFSNYTVETITSKFVQIFNLLTDSFTRKNKDSLKIMIEDIKGALADTYEKEYLKVLIGLFTSNSISQLQKDLLYEYVYDTSRIRGFFELKEYDRICSLYFEYKEKINIDSYYFEIAYSLHEKGYNDDSKKLYEYGIKNGKGGSAAYNNLALIYEKEQDLGKAHYLLEKALKLDPNGKAKSNLSRVKDLIQKAQVARKRDIFVSTATDMNQAKKKIAIAPSAFNIPDRPVQHDLVSVMMPFASNFTPVYSAIKEACSRLELRCLRADDLWENSTFIQDIFELIFCSKIVIVDFSGKNPNVFYEVGIAHTLGKIVVPLTQNIDDIPSDLKSHRALLYLPNSEGLAGLTDRLTSRLETIVRGRSWDIKTS